MCTVQRTEQCTVVITVLKNSVLQLNNVMYTVFDSVMVLDKYNNSLKDYYSLLKDQFLLLATICYFL